jgi:transposase
MAVKLGPSARSSARRVIRRAWGAQTQARPECGWFAGRSNNCTQRDNADCDLQLRLLLAGELPESWIPPAHILEVRTLVRLRKTLIDQRTAWQQRIHAELFHQGVPAGLRLRTEAGRQALAKAELSPAGRELVDLGLRMLDAFDLELTPLDRQLRASRAVSPAAAR